MAEGYISRKLMSIRFPVWLTWKSVWDIRQMGRKEKFFYTAFHEKLIELVEKEHRITKAIQLEKKGVEAAKTVEENSYRVAEYTSFEEDDLLHIFIALEKALLDSEGKINTSVPAAFRIKISAALIKASQGMQKAGNAIRKEEGEEYRDIMRVISAAVKAQGKNRKTVMEEVKTYLRVQPGILNRLLMRKECKLVRKDIHNVKIDKDQIEADLKKIERLAKKGTKNDAEWENMVDDLEYYLAKSSKDLEGAFKNAYYVLKRDFLMLYLLLSYLVDAEEEAGIWMAQNLMPKQPQYEIQSAMKDILKKIDVHMHEIAQAIRIIVNEDEQVEKLAKNIEAEAYKLAA